METLSKHAGPGLVAVFFVALALFVDGTDAKALAAITVAIWWAVIIGILVRVWPGSEAPRAAIACGASLAALAVFSGLSLLWADDAGRAFDEVVRVAGYLGLFALVVLASRRGSAASWAAGLAAGLGAVAALALLARFEPGLLTEGAGDLAAEIPSAAGRLAYPVSYWNGLGACMALAIVLLAWVAVRGRGRYARALAAGAVPLPVLAIYLTQSLGGAVAAVVGVAILLFAARERLALAAALAPGVAGGALLVLLASMREELIDATPGAELRSQGDEMLIFTIAAVAIVGIAVYALDPALRRLADVRARVPRAAAAGAAVVLLIVAVVALDPVERWEDFKDPGALAQPASGETGSGDLAAASAAGNGRYQWWSSALDGWADEPITGLSAANWELYWNGHSDLPVFTRHAHSLFFETFAELGLVGLLCVLAFFATAIAAGVGRRRTSRDEVAPWLGLIAAGIVSAAGEWTWQLPAAIVPVVIAAGVLTGPATLRPRWPRAVEGNGSRPGEPPAPRSRFGIGVATILLGFACIWVGGVSLLATIQLDESRADSEAGDYDAAARNARYASTIEPWSAEPRIELAGAEAARGRLTEARAAAEEAVDRADGDLVTHIVLARILARQGETAAAEAELERAQELSPQALGETLPPPDE